MGKSAKTYRDLLVRQKALDAAGLVVRITKGFPTAEVCGLSAQLGRCAVSAVSELSVSVP